MIDLYLAMVAMVFTIFAILMLYHFAHIKPKARLSPVYACGERLHPAPIRSDNFYLTFRQTFPRAYGWLERLHNEDLSDYLFWLALALTTLIVGGFFL